MPLRATRVYREARTASTAETSTAPNRRGAGGASTSGAAQLYPLACAFAQESLRVIVRLNTSAPGRESVSGVK